MTKSPLVTVVTPSLNQAEFIEDCLTSVMNQEDPVEHIVVDGGSTDGTLDILERYEKKYSLQWISEPDDGQAHALNKGITRANGKWIGWQNADDYYLEGTFETLRKAIETCNSAEFIYGNMKVVDEKGQEIDRRYMTTSSKFSHKHWSLFARNSSAFFTKSLYEQIGGFKEDLYYTMDADFFWKVLQENPTKLYVSNFLSAFRKHEEAKTAGELDDDHKKERDKIYELNRIEGRLPKNLLSSAGKLIKFSHLVRNKQWDALRWNLKY